MKIPFEHDFTISVTEQKWEQLPEVAEFYQDIYDVTLNFALTIMFVPDCEKTISDYSLILPENVDYVSTKLEARLYTVAFSDYVVTPNLLLAGQEEIISLPSVSDDIYSSEPVAEKVVIFYVSPQEFTIFSQELSKVAEQTLGVHNYVRVSAIKNLKFAKFILSNVIGSPKFSLEHLKYLGR